MNKLSEIFYNMIVNRAAKEILSTEPIKVFENKNQTHKKCEICGCYIDPINSVRIVTTSQYGVHYCTAYYCNTHKLPYHKAEIFTSSDTPNKYYAELEVNEYGEPVGYIKKK